MFIGRENTGWFGDYDLERAFILSSWLVVAAGAALLTSAGRLTPRPALLATGGILTVAGALLGVIAEWSLLSDQFRLTSVWGVVLASLLFLGEAFIAAGLLKGGLVANWIAWVVIVWNVLWLVTLLLISREDMYYPGLHYIPLLLIGIPLVRRRRPISAIED